MTQVNTAFSGAIPATYDACLGPMFFEPYAEDMARRLAHLDATHVLELASGTGVVTRHLLPTLRTDAHLVATDISDAMLAVARTRVPEDQRIEWRTADASALPFDDRSFDAVVMQFAIMFVPDRPAAFREMRRVTRAGGTVLLSTWGTLSENPIGRIAHDEIASFFHIDPPPFFTIPWAMNDADQIAAMFRQAGFTDVDVDVVDRVGVSATAEAAAKGLVFGTPVSTQIEERAGSPTAVMHAIAARLSEAGGAKPMRLPMRALLFTAR
jgi:SAM-dependent methyltransferase